MKKLALIAMLMLSVPALAGITVKAVQVPGTQNVEIRYEMTGGDTARPRAFGIEVVSTGAVSAINANTTTFYVEPGAFALDAATGTVTTWGDGIAGIGANQFTLEMGSLYAVNDPVHTTPPAASGLLATFTTTCDAVVTIQADAARGGVVMENATAPVAGYVVFTGCTVNCAPPPCECPGNVAGATPKSLPVDAFMTYADALTVIDWVKTYGSKGKLACPWTPAGW